MMLSSSIGEVSAVDVFEGVEVRQFIPASTSDSIAIGFVKPDDSSMEALQLAVELFIDIFCIGIKLCFAVREGEDDGMGSSIPCGIPM